MPPSWTPLAALGAIILMSAVRVWSVGRNHGVKAFSFGRSPALQNLAERNWRLAVALSLAFAGIAWAAPGWETWLGRPPWAEAPSLRWAAAGIFAASLMLIFVAQVQMGASWRVGVPAEGPGPLVAHGVFSWSRNPIFAGMIGALLALFVWSPHIGTGVVLAATWVLAVMMCMFETRV